MRVDLFDFELPPELIAQAPARPRDSARLLHIGASLAEATVLDLPAFLDPADILVVNDTRVLPTRFLGRRGQTRIEATLTRPLNGESWGAFLKPARKVRPGDRIELAPGLEAEVGEREPSGEVRLRFNLAGDALIEAIRAKGAMPLPPYIRREKPDPQDRDDYQTRFAREDGAVAAPTAGLHFTDRLVAALEARGVTVAPITLHVGIGTFQPVRVADTRDHVMHAEPFTVPETTARAIARTRDAGGRVAAVGTTVMRTLESIADEAGRIAPASGETGLFITPGYRFKAVDRLLTNFHLPKSTLFMLVCAFAGTTRMKTAYAHAVRRRFRFFSYGDACLIDHNPEADAPA